MNKKQDEPWDMTRHAPMPRPKYDDGVKAKSEEALLKDLHKRFAFLGESTAVIFLFSVGEEMPETIKRIQAAHGTR